MYPGLGQYFFFFNKHVAQIQGKNSEIVIYLSFKNLLMGEIMKIVAIEMYIVKVAFGQWRKKWINW